MLIDTDVPNLETPEFLIRESKLGKAATLDKLKNAQILCIKVLSNLCNQWEEIEKNPASQTGKGLLSFDEHIWKKYNNSLSKILPLKFLEKMHDIRKHIQWHQQYPNKNKENLLIFQFVRDLHKEVQNCDLWWGKKQIKELRSTLIA